MCRSQNNSVVAPLILGRHSSEGMNGCDRLVVGGRSSPSNDPARQHGGLDDDPNRVIRHGGTIGRLDDHDELRPRPGRLERESSRSRSHELSLLIDDHRVSRRVEQLNRSDFRRSEREHVQLTRLVERQAAHHRLGDRAQVGRVGQVVIGVEAVG